MRHRAWGRVFGDRYKCVVVEGELPEYMGAWWITSTLTRRGLVLLAPCYGAQPLIFKLPRAPSVA